ncbi:MAG: hypothetical protein IPO87_16875 [Flavobacteriales bacterium]|nr:hypothetical protein [Flavobacteriales bacterium]
MDICTGSSSMVFASPYGKVRSAAVTDRILRIRADGGGTLCATSTNTTVALRPQIRFNYTPGTSCSSTPAGGQAVASVATGCGTVASSTLSVTGSTSASGLTYQWFSGPIGGPYLTPLGTATTQVVTGVTTSTGYVRATTCPSFPTAFFLPATITINTTPTVGVGASPVGPFCAGQTSTLTGTGATTYTWAPAAGLSATNTNPVTFTAGNTTTYTVTGTTSGCSSTATVTLNVNGTPVVNSVTATPNPICANGSSQLNVNASDPATASVTGYAFVATTGALDPMTGATDLGVSGDDSQSAITNIGFTFSYEAAPYTTFSANSNGSARLGAAVGAPFPGYDNTSAFLSSTLHPLWDDHSANSVSTVLIGTAPNRIRIINQDLNISFGNQGTMQIWLYEGSNVIEYRYAASTGIPGSSTIALAGANPANFISITPPSSSSTVARNNSVTGWPGASVVYRFTPPVSVLSATWSPSTYLDDPNITNPLASSVASTQAYTVTVSNGTCSAVGNVTITVNPAISGVTLTPVAPRYCAGLSVILTAAPIDGGGPFNYQWTDPNSNAAGTNATQVANIAGLWSVSITDACGGPAATNSVTVIEDPTL